MQGSGGYAPAVGVCVAAARTIQHQQHQQQQYQDNSSNMVANMNHQHHFGSQCQQTNLISSNSNSDNKQQVTQTTTTRLLSSQLQQQRHALQSQTHHHTYNINHHHPHLQQQHHHPHHHQPIVHANALANDHHHLRLQPFSQNLVHKQTPHHHHHYQHHLQHHSRVKQQLTSYAANAFCYAASQRQPHQKPRQQQYGPERLSLTPDALIDQRVVRFEPQQAAGKCGPAPAPSTAMRARVNSLSAILPTKSMTNNHRVLASLGPISPPKHPLQQQPSEPISISFDATTTHGPQIELTELCCTQPPPSKTTTPPMATSTTATTTAMNTTGSLVTSGDDQQVTSGYLEPNAPYTMMQTSPADQLSLSHVAPSSSTTSSPPHTTSSPPIGTGTSHQYPSSTTTTTTAVTNINSTYTGDSCSNSNNNSLGINLEQYISKRNERERSRVRNVNDAFDNLKNSLPLDISKLTKRMSKVEILRTAINYIRDLECVLSYNNNNNNNCIQQQQEEQISPHQQQTINFKLQQHHYLKSHHPPNNNSNSNSNSNNNINNNNNNNYTDANSKTNSDNDTTNASASKHNTTSNIMSMMMTPNGNDNNTTIDDRTFSNHLIDYEANSDHGNNFYGLIRKGQHSNNDDHQSLSAMCYDTGDVIFGSDDYEQY